VSMAKGSSCHEVNIHMDDDFVHVLMDGIPKKVTSFHVRCSPPNYELKGGSTR